MTTDQAIELMALSLASIAESLRVLVESSIEPSAEADTEQPTTYLNGSHAN